MDKKIGKHKLNCQCPFCKAKRGELKGKNSPNYKYGKTSIVVYCVDCGKQLGKYACFNGSKRCPKCASKGKLSYHYIDGRTLKKYYCKDCNKQITVGSKSGSCRKCSGKNFSGKNNPMYGKVAKGSGRGKGSYYKGTWMRSTWEIKYAKWLDENRLRWKYEFKRFDLGDCTYTPDFYLPDTNEWIEIKGYISNKNKKKMDIFQEKYPDLNFEILQKKELENLGIEL